MKPARRNRRLLVLAGGATALAGALALVLGALNDNLAYFYSPVQIERGEADGRVRLRLGGLVEAGSVKRGDDGVVSFTVTDGAAVLPVRYEGVLPDLFREGQGVIAQGRLGADGVFAADVILAKHDENYRPRELEEALKEAAEEPVGPGG